jgi:hypothetical protein
MHYASVFVSVLLVGCCGPVCQVTTQDDNPRFGGGGIDPVTAQLPFAYGYDSLCTQGAFGDTSHHYVSTLYDVDLDTPNDLDDPVFAPVAGTAYVHDDPDSGFGIHVNIDLGNGSYIILAHLHSALVDSGSEVAAGQLIGIECSTGDSTGDHIHMGLHAGEAALDGVFGESIDGLLLEMQAGDQHVTLSTSDMWCSLSGGDVYSSLLGTPLWHPNGSLVKTPLGATVYLIENGGAVPFLTEAAFLSRNFDFADLSLISEDELMCYELHPGISEASTVAAVMWQGQAWLLVGNESDPERYRLELPPVGWQAVLKTWGVIASSYDDLAEDSGQTAGYPDHGTATFRDGSLVSPLGQSAVYVMSDGVAMPIETWEVVLFSGWENRAIIEVNDSEFEAAVPVAGDCAAGIHCLTLEDVKVCGGPGEEHSSGQGSALPGTDGPETALSADLTVTWFMPDNALADALTLVGAVTPAGGLEQAWGSVFNEVLNASSISVTVPGLKTGDSLRFSVQYIDDAGERGWSCLGPFPPGEVQGSIIAEYQGVYLGFTPSDDPLSDGCGLTVSVP